MKPFWIAFIAGIIVGAGMVIITLIGYILSLKPCDHYLPDIEDIEAEK